MTYRIVRYFASQSDMKSIIIAEGLTLAAAQAHCSDPVTYEQGEWFDGYEEETERGIE